MNSTVETPVAAEPAVVIPRSRLPAFLVIGLAMAWGLVLLLLTLFTANPVTLNRGQILESQWVIVGKVTGADKVVKSDPAHWPFQDRDEIRIDNLKDTGALIGEIYLIPLIPLIGKEGLVPGSYLVTPTRLPEFPPLIYPMSPDAEQQLQKIIEKP
ncbi:MAG TPA: hypothetical protein VNQ76_06410 [Planctomicrobium sp.]|nr:hypothetical protein [Planctomicrobium sp.]